MTKQTLIDDLASANSLSKAEATRAVDQTFSSLGRVLAGGVGTRVVIPGFGTFESKMSTRTQARNPRTGEAIAITPRPKTKFKPTTAK